MKINNLEFITRPNSTDESIIKNVVGDDEYSAKDLISEDDVVVDIGAHIGSFSILANSLGADVYSYEPFDSSFSTLFDNCQLNNCAMGMIHHEAVMGDRNPRKIHVHDGNFGGNNFYQFATTDVETRCITLDDVFEGNHIAHIDFLKLDCEGAEYEILKNTAKLDDISIIAFEYVGSERRSEMLQLLRNKFEIIRDKHNDAFGTIVMKRK